MRLSFISSRRKPPAWQSVVGMLLLAGQMSNAIELDLENVDSIKSAAKTIAHGMMTFYTGNRTGDVPGNLPQPYYWWECGAMFGALIDYWYYTGDSEYNEVVTQGMLHQVGPNLDFMTKNQSRTAGNDDQAFWGMAAMSAAENKFPDPPKDQPQWLALAQAVFNSQAVRWDNATCNGGLRWQVFTFNNGYHYKNTISNGCFFNIAARLARYTGNSSYAEWAETMWDWSTQIGIIGAQYQFYDGTDANINCIDVNHIQWTYNAGVYLLGAAHMYSFTKEQRWKDRLDAIINATSVFFSPEKPNVMFEVACEPNNCNVDQRSFKAYLSRWMAATTKIAPHTYDVIMPKLRTSAQAAAAQCNGGPDGNTCGIVWTQPNWDGSTGVGEQMCALEVIQSNLISKVEGPVTQEDGGTSKGDPAAGMAGDVIPPGIYTSEITTSDKVGAGFLTLFVLVGVIGGAWWMVA